MSLSLHLETKMIADCVLIVDDHPVYRDALTEKLAADFAVGNIKVMGVGSSQLALDTLAQSDRRWLVILDIKMPGLSGLAGIKSFKMQPNVAAVASLSGLDEKLWEPRALSAGASIFLSKNNTSHFIFKKISQLLRDEKNAVVETLATEPVTDPRLQRLTDRQREVLKLIAQGHPNKIIASLLEIKEQTVKIHINQIFKELQVFNRTQAALMAQRSNFT